MSFNHEALYQYLLIVQHFTNTFKYNATVLFCTLGLDLQSAA